MPNREKDILEKSNESMKRNKQTTYQDLLCNKKNAQKGSNKRALIKVCNDLATYYHKQKRYHDALDQYKEEATMYEEIGLRREWGICNSMIGEIYMLLAEFDEALKYEQQHLAVARELKDPVREQKAIATLGRIHLLRGQSTSDVVEARSSLRAAEDQLMKSFVLCQSLKGKISKHELMNMEARFFLNIGVVHVQLGSVDKGLDFISRAVCICSNEHFYELLHQCYITEALIHENNKDFAKALRSLKKAWKVTDRINDKVQKPCETLSLIAGILWKKSDYQMAKGVLTKAWKLKNPVENDRQIIESNLKIVAAMFYTERRLTSTDPSDHIAFKKLYEKLGDGACLLKNYAGAINYYLKMLDHAMLAGETGKQLIPTYVSLFQTYKDMGCYEEALLYYEKEYELIKDEPKEAYTTLFNIAEALYQAKKPYPEIEKACLDAWKAARDLNNKKYEIRILKNLLKYQKGYFETNKIADTTAKLRALEFYNFDNLENSEDEQSCAGDVDAETMQIGDDICLEDLTDLSDTNDDEITETKCDTRKRSKAYKIKKNLKGETELHRACIVGNKLLVKVLLANGHPVNERDNAGWLPLHEACIRGWLEIVQILIDHGADVNDRGGKNCDGRTPLYDAACKGHLEVIKLLLEEGANPTIKTEFNESPLKALQNWRGGTILNTDNYEIMYNNICDRIQAYTNMANTNRSKPVALSEKIIIKEEPSTSEIIDSIKEEVTSPEKRPMVDNEDIGLSLNEQNQAVFSSDTSLLRKRSINHEIPEVHAVYSRPNVEAEEVYDDGSNNDIVNDTQNKIRKLSSPKTTVSENPPIQNNDSTDGIIENIPVFQKNENNDNDNCTSSSNSRSVPPFSRKVSNKNICWTKSSAGGSKQKSKGNASNESHKPMNVQPEISILPMRTQFLPPSAVKVHVEDKIFVIAVNLNVINELSIRWLVDEVKSRFFKHTGRKQIFHLLTSDGCILSEDDPLSLIFVSPETMPELKTCISSST